MAHHCCQERKNMSYDPGIQDQPNKSMPSILAIDSVIHRISLQAFPRRRSLAWWNTVIRFLNFQQGESRMRRKLFYTSGSLITLSVPCKLKQLVKRPLGSNCTTPWGQAENDAMWKLNTLSFFFFFARKTKQITLFCL